MDTWRAVHNSDSMWFVLREIYSSVLVCVANRSTSPANVMVDCSRVAGWEVLAADSARVVGTTAAVECVVRGNSTRVVCALSATDAQEAKSFDCAAVQIAMVQQRTPVVVDESVLDSAVATSRAVEAFFANRTR
jgi:hypothetical protein